MGCCKDQKWVKPTVITAIVLAVISFTMIVTVYEVKNHNLQDEVNSKVPLTNTDYSQWGQVPGDFKWQFTRYVKPFVIQSFENSKGNATLALNTEGPFEFLLTRDFIDLEQSSDDLIRYKENLTYPEMSQMDQVSESINFNYAALSTFYQMTHKPRYWYAWSALQSLNSVMMQMPLTSQFQAYNAFAGWFHDLNNARESLSMFDSEQQSRIWGDATYGMNTVPLMRQWVDAALEYNDTTDTTKVTYNAIIAYYQALGIPNFDDTTMSEIVGPDGKLGTIMIWCYDALINYAPFDLQNVTDINSQVNQMQWGRGDLFSETSLFYNASETAQQPSQGVPFISAQWVTYPEYASLIFTQNLNDSSNYQLTFDQISALLEQSLTSTVTLLNPLNVRDLFGMHEDGLVDDIQSRFGLTSDQGALMYQYLDNLVEAYYFQGQEQANEAMMGYLLMKSFNSSYTKLQEVMAWQTTTRNYAQFMHQHSDEVNCSTMVLLATADQTLTDTICGMYSFDDLETNQMFTNATWYCTTLDVNCSYYNTVQNATAMSDAQLTAFYDVSIVSSYGYYLNDTQARIAAYYNCSNGLNCTATELADLQFSSCGVTYDPVVPDWKYTPPKQYSVISWGIYPVSPFTDYAPELFYYTMNNTEFNMTSAQIAAVFSSSVYDLGLGLYYNAARLSTAYYTQNHTVLQEYSNYYDAMDMSLFCESMFEHVQTYLMHGVEVMLNNQQIVFGYDNPIIDQIIGGDYWQGADFDLLTYVQPIVNDFASSISENIFEIQTGASDKNNVCQMSSLNGLPYINKPVQIYNGTGYTTVYQQPGLAVGATNGTKFSTTQTSNGLQFQPWLNDDSVISMFEPGQLAISTYYRNESYTWGGDPALKTDIFISDWPYDGLDQGFLYDNYYKLVSDGCSNCQNTTKTLAFNMTWGTYNYTYGTLKNSSHNLYVQPSTGYTYNQNYDYDIFLNITGVNWDDESGLYPPFPLHNISSIFDVPVPMFDMQEAFKADDSKFYNNQKYVPQNVQSMTSWIIVLIVVGCILLVAAALIVVIVRCKKHREQKEALALINNTNDQSRSQRISEVQEAEEQENSQEQLLP